jgi:hypothetical protein
MGRIVVEQLADAVIETHRRRARLRGVSLEQELHDVITRAAGPELDELLRRLDVIRAMTPTLPPGAIPVPAEDLIREDRDSR